MIKQALPLSNGGIPQANVWLNGKVADVGLQHPELIFPRCLW